MRHNISFDDLVVTVTVCAYIFNNSTILMEKKYDENSIRAFANEIDRDPGIVFGRLLVENRVNYSNTDLCKKLGRKFSAMVPG